MTNSFHFIAPLDFCFLGLNPKDKRRVVPTKGYIGLLTQIVLQIKEGKLRYTKLNVLTL